MVVTDDKIQEEGLVHFIRTRTAIATTKEVGEWITILQKKYQG